MIETGATAGAGSALRWALRSFVRAVTSSRNLGQIVGLATFWLRFFDGKNQAHQDGACGTYFYGIKASNVIAPREIVDFYAECAAR